MHLLCQKSEMFTAYQGFETWLDCQLSARIKLLHSDRGSKHQGKQFVLYLQQQGTEQCFTAHDTPQHNGVAEQLNHTILECVRAMLHASKLPRFLWGEAARHAVWLKNRTPTKALNGKTPYEAAFHKKPDLSHIHEWGSDIYVWTEDGNKLGGRIEVSKWVGIDDKTKYGCHIYWPSHHTITVECNIIFKPMQGDIEGEEGTNDDITYAHIPTTTSSPTPSPVKTQISPAAPLPPPTADNKNEPRPKCT